MPEVETHVVIPGNVDRRSGEKVTAHIVVGTPGTVMDCLRRGLIESRHLTMLILDEADNLLDQQGLGDQAIRVKNLVPADTQFILFGATFHEKDRAFGDNFAPRATKLMLQRHQLNMTGVRQMYMDCRDEEHKYQVLSSLYHACTVSSSIVFVKVCLFGNG